MTTIGCASRKHAPASNQLNLYFSGTTGPSHTGHDNVLLTAALYEQYVANGPGVPYRTAGLDVGGAVTSTPTSPTDVSLELWWSSDRGHHATITTSQAARYQAMGYDKVATVGWVAGFTGPNGECPMRNNHDASTQDGSLGRQPNPRHHHHHTVGASSTVAPLSTTHDPPSVNNQGHLVDMQRRQAAASRQRSAATGRTSYPSHNATVMATAWGLLVDAMDEPGFQPSGPYTYDVVDAGRQALDNALWDVMRLAETLYANGDAAGLNATVAAGIAVFHDMDRLLATDSNFLLGDWIGSARDLAGDAQEADMYEFNARNQITWWGNRTTGAAINDYARKQVRYGYGTGQCVVM